MFGADPEPESEPETEPEPMSPPPADPATPQAIEQVYTANDRYVDAYCACYAGALHGGDRAACAAEQPSRADLAPNACDNAAFTEWPAEGNTFLGCVAGAIDDFRLCYTGCPPPGTIDYSICFDILNAGYTTCLQTAPAPLRQRLVSCG